jgi:PRC-barrel domain
MTAAFAAIFAAATPMAFAQTTTTMPPGSSATTTGSPVRTPVTANHLLPGQIRATQMNGATVYDGQNQNLGDIKDIILDRDGRIAAVILNVGATLGVGGRYVAVAMDDLKVSSGPNDKPRFAVSLTKDQLKSSQAYDLNEAKTGTSTAPAIPPADRTR